MESRQRAAAAKRGIQLAVGIEPCQARHTAHHDLPVRLESDCLWLVYVLAAEGDLDGSEGRIRDSCFAETKRFDGSPLEAVANSLGPNIVAVRLKDDWVNYSLASSSSSPKPSGNGQPIPAATGIAFTFRPECCSESQRNRVRVQSGIAFTFDRIAQRDASMMAARISPIYVRGDRWRHAR